jgi:hypothetical protein
MLSIHDLKRLARRSAPLAAIVALSLALGGCLVSRQPLFAQASAVAPLGDGGRYVAYERIGNRYKRDETMQLRRSGAGYDYINEKGAITPVTLHSLGGDLFAVQAQSDDGGYTYARLRLRGATGFIAIADCDKQDPKKLAALGIATKVNDIAKAITGRDDAQTHDCILDGVRDIRKVFSTLEFGAPTSKVVRE